MFYIISNNISPVAAHTSQMFTSILTDKIVIGSHRQVILKTQYSNAFAMVQDAAYGPGHCIVVTLHEI